MSDFKFINNLEKQIDINTVEQLIFLEQAYQLKRIADALQK